MSQMPSTQISIVGVIAEDVGVPRNDGSPGSGLYAVPFKLSRVPSASWVRLFRKAWDLPPRFTSMHRPGIARVEGDRVVLDGTTIDEVERFHLETLKLAVAEANRLEDELEHKSRTLAEKEEKKREDHLRHVADVANRLKFEP